MKFYFAPMEGVTGYIYRNVHHKFYGGVDKYFMPFVSPTQNGSFNPKERKDVIREHNLDICVVPQILANNAAYFTKAEQELREFGYDEINLNLGCPSNTVVAKCKGSGLLFDTYRLETFLEEIFIKASGKISIKTRLGRYDEEEFQELIQIFNRYPISQLIIHPRIQKDFYKNPIRTEVFLNAFSQSANPVCYNGDICSVEDYKKLKLTCPNLEAVMIGRGALSDPNLFNELKEAEKGTVDRIAFDLEKFKQFHWELYTRYRESIGNNSVFKMKELWIYMGKWFPNGEKYLKKIRKVQKMSDYEQLVERLFQS